MSFFSWCQIVRFIMLVPNCPGAKLSGAKLSVFIMLVPNCLGAKLSGAKLSWCQIVRVQNCPVPNCPTTKLGKVNSPMGVASTLQVGLFTIADYKSLDILIFGIICVLNIGYFHQRLIVWVWIPRPLHLWQAPGLDPQCGREDCPGRGFWNQSWYFCFCLYYCWTFMVWVFILFGRGGNAAII